MKTIAITIEDEALRELDRVARSAGPLKANRSEIVRRAVDEYLARVARRTREEKDDMIIHEHHKKLNRQARSLVRGQAKP